MSSQPPAGPPGSHSSAPVDIASLNRDIEELISVSRVEVGQNPNDQGVQQRLKGLLSLQTLLQTQNVPPDQLVLVKIQVADLAVKLRPPGHAGAAGAAAAAAPPHVPYQTPLAASSAPSVVPSSSLTSPAPQPGSVTLDTLFGKGALASLRQSVTPQVPTPTPPPATQQQQPGPAVGTVPIRSPQPPHPPPSAGATPDPMALLAGLRKAGLISGVSTPTPPPPAVTPVFPGAAGPPPPHPGMAAAPTAGLLPPGLAQLLKNPNLGVGAISDPARLMSNIQLDATSLKRG